MLLSAEAVSYDELLNFTPIPLINEDTNLELTSNLLYIHIHPEILNLIKYGKTESLSLRTVTLQKFIDELKVVHNNTISSKQPLVQELFIMHQFCKALYSYNTKYLNFSHTEFRSRVLYPNLIYSLVRFFHKAHNFLRVMVKSEYNAIKGKAYGMIQQFANSYYLDQEIIRTDALYTFLGNGLRSVDPLTINNIAAWYKSAFRSIFYYYFQKEQALTTRYTNVSNLDNHVSKMLDTPTRQVIYRDVLYKLQIEKFCEESPTLSQLGYNFNIFKNVILNNEFQNIYYATKTDTFMMNNNEYKLMKIYHKEHEDELLKKIKELPLIYKLLKSVRIVNPKSRPFNDKAIKLESIKMAVLEELMHPFKNMIADQHIIPVLSKIADNFIDNISNGEYINILTLTPIKVNHISFITQIKKFINICLSEVEITRGIHG